MKFFLILLLLILISSCSFDNKTGIWQNSDEINSSKEDRFKGFETLYTETKSFESIIQPENDLEIILDPVQSNLKWTDEYYRNSNI